MYHLITVLSRGPGTKVLKRTTSGFDFYTTTKVATNHSNGAIRFVIGQSVFEKHAVQKSSTLILIRGESAQAPYHFRHQNAGTAKDRALRFCDFSQICLGYKVLCLSVVHRYKNPIWRRKTGSMQAVCCHLWDRLAHIIFRALGHIVTKFQRLYPCFPGPAVQWFCQRCHRKSRYTGNRYGGCANRK